ncbi:hypothetical protein [Pseudomonas putida]|uniref:Uncharacterized protein n=1 Tax=Pseudomonas putida TaxID=303 RepID=A0A8I1EAJ3_PSEPU|nr:hypothetical protein [Pseudomonas putida]MBI6882900.1 hypothetical protein [Pseudomonas putida]
MTTHPDVSERYLLIVQALKMASAFIRPIDNGFSASAVVNCSQLSEPLKDNLQEILVGEWDEARMAFSSLVCDNNEQPICFMTEAEALSQARMLTDALVRRYCYGLYASHGIIVKPEEQAVATLHFYKNGRP